MTGGRKKKICLEDHSMKQKKVNSIWRPVATKASACEGLYFLSWDMPMIFIISFCVMRHFGKCNTR